MLLSLPLAALLLAPAFTATGDLFTQDLERAKADAVASGRNLLLDFTGSDWCIWCQRLDGEVFQVEPFAQQVTQQFVPVTLDYPRDTSRVPEEFRARNEELRQRYGIRGYPTIILADAAGRPFAATGYREGGPEAYLKHLDELLQHKKLRDAAFARADEATGLARARLLDAALMTLEPGFLTPFYDDVIAEIVRLDADDEAGLASRYRLRVDAALAARIRAEIDAAVSQHTDSGDWIGLIQAMNDVLDRHGKNPQVAQRALFQRASAELELGDLAAGKASLDAARAHDEKGELVVTIDRMLRLVNRQLDQGRHR